MKRPPRNLSRDKLVAWPLLRYSYLIAGLCETVACFMVYFEVCVFVWNVSQGEVFVSMMELFLFTLVVYLTQLRFYNLLHS